MALASAPGDTVLLPSLAPPEKMSAVDTSVATQTKPPDAAPGDGTDDELALTRALAAELEAHELAAVRDVLLNEIKQQQQRAVEYENTAASVAAQQAEGEQRSAEADEAAMRQQEAAVSELRAAIDAARIAHVAALTSYDVDDTMTASSMVSRPRRERDLVAAEARRLETEVEDLGKRSVTIEAALRVARSETAQLLEDAAHAKENAEQAASALPALREKVAEAESHAELLAQAVQDARTRRAELAAQAEASARKLQHAMSAARDAEGAKAKALRECLRAESALNSVRATLPPLQQPILNAHAAVAVQLRAQEVSAAEARTLQIRLDEVIADVAKAQGSLPAGAAAVASAAAEEAALRDSVQAASVEVQRVRRAWEEARQGLDRARSSLAATRRQVSEAQQKADVRRAEADAMRRDVEATKGQIGRLDALIGEVLAQKSGYAAATAQARSIFADLTAQSQQGADDVRALETELEKKEKQLANARVELSSARAALQRTAADIRQARAEEHTAKDALEEALAHSRALGASAAGLERACAAETAAFAAAAAARTVTATALVNATAKLAALQEQLKLTDKAHRLVALQASKEEEHVALLKRQLHAVQRSCEVASRKAAAVPLLESAVASLKAQVFLERRAADVEAAKQAAAPSVRILSGPPMPSAETLAQRDRALREALAAKERQLAERSAEAAAAVAATEEARAAVTASADGVRILTQLNEARARAFRLQRSVQALTAEIRVYVKALGLDSASVAASRTHVGSETLEACSYADQFEEEIAAQEAALEAFVTSLPGVAEAEALAAGDDAAIGW